MKSAVELATAVDVLCVCLRSDHDLLELLQGGVLDALPSGAILMNHATGDPGEARAFEETCKAKEIRFVDAPVSEDGPERSQGRSLFLRGDGCRHSGKSAAKSFPP